MSGVVGEFGEVEELFLAMREARDDRENNWKQRVRAMTRREEEK